MFADRREYLNELRELLHRKLQQTQAKGELTGKDGNNPIETATCYTDKDFIRIVGGAGVDELDRAEIHSKVIFTTYQYMGTGKSIVKMNGLVLAHSRKNKMRQFINRIFRLGSDATITREIWDICDIKTRIAAQWRTRKEYYESKKYKIIERVVKYDTIDTYLPLKPAATEAVIPEIKPSDTADKTDLNTLDNLADKLDILSDLAAKKTKSPPAIPKIKSKPAEFAE